MNLLYAANIRMPTERAHGAQVAHMCAAFTQVGAQTTLLVPNRRNHLQEDLFDYYQVPRLFDCDYCMVPDTVSWGKLGFLIESICFGLQVALRAWIYKPDIIYGRDEMVLATASLFTRIPIIWETHTGAWNVAVRMVVRRARGVVAISHGLKSWYVAKGVHDELIHVGHDGIDLASFECAESTQSARARLGISNEKPVALYMGSIGGWKGTDTFFEAAALCPGVQFVVIGGSADDVDACRKRYPHIQFLGERPYREAAGNQRAADVLVLPNTARNVISAEFTSPLKLFTYLAAGKALVLSDVPSVREVADEQVTEFFEPDNPTALAKAITRALLTSGENDAARALAKQYTWDARAKNIVDWIVKRDVVPTQDFLQTDLALLLPLSEHTSVVVFGDHTNTVQNHMVESGWSLVEPREAKLADHMLFLEQVPRGLECAKDVVQKDGVVVGSLPKDLIESFSKGGRDSITHFWVYPTRKAPRVIVGAKDAAGFTAVLRIILSDRPWMRRVFEIARKVPGFMYFAQRLRGEWIHAIGL